MCNSSVWLCYPLKLLVIVAGMIFIAPSILTRTNSEIGFKKKKWLKKRKFIHSDCFTILKIAFYYAE